MKIWDKIFIAAMVLILCLAWVLWLHEFGKNRNLNGINVVWEAKWNIKADDLTVSLQVIATWIDSAQRWEILNERLNMFEGLFSWNIIDRNNWCYSESYETEACRFRNSNLWWWCRIWSICLNFTWDINNAIEYVQNLLSGYNSYTNTNWTLTVSNNWDSANEMKALANQNAQQNAERIANSLWVKLWKLLVYSENGFNWWVNQYYWDQIILRNWQGFPKSFEIPYTATVYHTYAIK